MACGIWKKKFETAFSSHTSRALVHTCELTESERSGVLRDFSLGKDSMALVIHAKFNIYQSLPHNLIGVAHDSEDEARWCAQNCLSLFAQLDPDKDKGVIHNALVQRFLSPSGHLSADLKQFARGTSRSCLSSSFIAELTKMRLIPVAEVSIEAKHAVAKNALLSVKRASLALFSISLRWPEIRSVMQHEHSLELLLQAFESYRKTPIHILESFDMASHPEVQEALLRVDALPVGEARQLLLKTVRHVFYHADLTSQYSEKQSQVCRVLGFAEQLDSLHMSCMICGCCSVQSIPFLEVPQPPHSPELHLVASVGPKVASSRQARRESLSTGLRPCFQSALLDFCQKRMEHNKYYSVVAPGRTPKSKLQDVVGMRVFPGWCPEVVPRGCVLDPDQDLQQLMLGELAFPPFEAATLQPQDPQAMLEAAALTTRRGHTTVLFRCVRAQPALIKTGQPSVVAPQELAVVVHTAEKVQSLGGLRIDLDPVGQGCLFLWSPTALGGTLEELEACLYEWEVDLSVKAGDMLRTANMTLTPTQKGVALTNDSK